MQMQHADLGAGVAGRQAAPVPYAPVGLNPNPYDWKAPKVTQWNLGMQMRLPAMLVLDVAYVGSESTDLLQQRQINALPYGTAYQASARIPTRGQTCTGCSGLSTSPAGMPCRLISSAPTRGTAPSACGSSRPTRTTRPCRRTVTRRFNHGFLFAFNYTQSSAKGIAGGDWDGARIDGKDREANYGPLAQDRPNVFVTNFVYQTPDLAQRRPGLPHQRLAGVGHLPVHDRRPVRRPVQHLRDRGDQPHGLRPERAHRASAATRARGTAATRTSSSTPRRSWRPARAATASSRPAST